MEDTLWAGVTWECTKDYARLNPYSNGRYSMSLKYIISLFSMT